MKKLLVSAFLLALGVSQATAHAAAIEQVIVRQQWPWSTDIKVEYRLSGVTAPVNLGIKAYNGDVELPLPASAVTGDWYGIASDGIGQIMINPVEAFGTSQIALANFKVKLTVSESDANANEVIYKIFDLKTGACEDVKRSDFYNHPDRFGSFETDFSRFGKGFNTSETDLLIWTGVTNDVAYKTTKLVMRKIPAKGKVWTMGDHPSVRSNCGSQIGSGSFETNHLVRLSYDYWIGVFELTRKQVETIGGTLGMTTSAADADVLPASRLVFGNYGAEGAYAARYAQLLRDRTKVASFDVPSECEWEFACRAGTSTCVYSGRVTSDGYWSGCSVVFDEVAWFAGNASDLHAVGCKVPNAFGLYDILGNVLEYTRDLRGATSADYYASFGADWTPEKIVDDPARVSTGYNLLRGGSYATVGAYVRSGDRTNSLQNWTTANPTMGLRVMMR